MVQLADKPLIGSATKKCILYLLRLFFLFFFLFFSFPSRFPFSPLRRNKEDSVLSLSLHMVD